MFTFLNILIRFLINENLRFVIILWKHRCLSSNTFKGAFYWHQCLDRFPLCWTDQEVGMIWLLTHSTSQKQIDSFFLVNILIPPLLITIPLAAHTHVSVYDFPSSYKCQESLFSCVTLTTLYPDLTSGQHYFFTPFLGSLLLSVHGVWCSL